MRDATQQSTTGRRRNITLDAEYAHEDVCLTASYEVAADEAREPAEILESLVKRAVAEGAVEIAGVEKMHLSIRVSYPTQALSLDANVRSSHAIAEATEALLALLRRCFADNRIEVLA